MPLESVMHPNTTLIAPMTYGPRELSPFLEKKKKLKNSYCTIPKLDLSAASLNIAQKHKLFLHFNIPDSKSASYMKLKEKKNFMPQLQTKMAAFCSPSTPKTICISSDSNSRLGLTHQP